MDGYILMEESGVAASKLEEAIELLIRNDLLRVKGESRGPRLGES